MGFEHAPRGALVQVDFVADLAGDAGDLVERQAVKVVTLAGAKPRRSSHSRHDPTTASGVTSSPASACPVACMRASAQARTTPIKVSLASAYTAAGITQMATSRQPRPAAIAFMVNEIATHATFSARGRSALRPCSANAIPSAAKISAPASGMPASRAAMAGVCRAE